VVDLEGLTFLDEIYHLFYCLGSNGWDIHQLADCKEGLFVKLDAVGI
jgi:hypothetical protein